MIIMLRRLQITFSVTCGVICLLLIVLWVRSYWRCDIAMGQSSTSIRSYFVLGSVRGFLAIGAEPGFSSLRKVTDWDFDSYPPDYHERLPEPTYLGFHFARYASHSVLFVPYWFPVVMTVSWAVIPWVPWSRRFSIRTLLIATTLLALMLGAIVYAVR
jgi:hypothetical protein